MRRIVKCHQCSRRYNASKKEPGYRFRCRCGHVLEVQVARSHEAEVVCCSACGGSREKGATRCGFCGTDFTIHDQDIDTVCPTCFARVSDRARFCCQCATPLSAEEVAGETTEQTCPVCGDDVRLVSRRLGDDGVNILECSHCAGFWLAHTTFSQLRDRVRREGVKPGETFRVPRRGSKLDNQRGNLYRKCIVCGKLMSRRAYGRGSGVIIDACRDHGIWFDADELHRIVEWITTGGRDDRDEDYAKKIRRETASKTPILGPPPQPGDSTIGQSSVFGGGLFDSDYSDRPDFLTLLASSLIGDLFTLFRR